MIKRRIGFFLLATTAPTVLLLSLAQAAEVAPAQQATQTADAGNTGNIETIVVTGTRIQALDLKRQADVILDIAPRDQIISLPDSNAAEALQRLPGISMESDSGEGRFVNIRGMDADLNGTTYDGVRLTASNPASPQSGARAVAFDAFPTGILGGIEVIKSLTPEIDAEGLGGVVNIQPRTIPEGKDYFVDASLGGGVETLRNSPVYKGDITLGKRFNDDMMAVVLSYGYQQDHRGIDDIEADYINDPTTVPAGTSAFLTKKAFDDVQYRWYKYGRKRQGYGGSFSFTPDPTSEIYVRGLHAGYTEVAKKHEFIVAGLADNIQSVSAAGDVTSLGATSRYTDINTKEEVGNDLIEVGGHTMFGDVKADARFSWTEGFDQFPYSVNVRFNNSAPFTAVYNNTDATRPVVSAAGGINLVNPALYAFAKGTNSPSAHSDAEYAGVANFSAPLDIAGDGGVLKFGVSARQRTRRGEQYTSSLKAANKALASYIGGPDNIYYGGAYNLGPQPNYAALLDIPQSAVTATPSSFSDDDENVYAGYGQYSMTFGQVDVVGGLRAERTEGTFRANTLTTDASGATTVTPNLLRHSYTNLFPDISLKYHVNSDLQVVAAFSTAIARPGFNQITASRSVDLQNANPIVTQGNPNLKPTLGRSFDLNATYVLPNDGIISAGVFYKAFSDYIISTEQTNALNVTDFVGQKVDYISYSNVGSAHAAGVEAAYSQKLAFLPGLLGGLGVEGNLTYVDSKGQIRPGEQSRLPQTSTFSYNAGLFYSEGPLYLKLAGAYVSSNLWAVGGDTSTDIYAQPRFRLDFGGTYDVTSTLQVFANIKNITNTHLEFTQTNDRNFPIQREFYDADYLAGIRIKL